MGATLGKSRWFDKIFNKFDKDKSGFLEVG